MTNNRNGAHGDRGETFEQSFARLQEVVQKLSEGNLTLQEALAAFEEGMAVAGSCAQMLDQAELRVKQVSERAVRSTSIEDLEERASEAEPEVLSFEIETTYESTVEFDEPVQQPGKAPRDARPHRSAGAGGPIAGPPEPPGRESAASTYIFGKSLASEELDPLFDEDD